MLFNFLDKELENFSELEPWQVDGFITVKTNDIVILNEEDEI